MAGINVKKIQRIDDLENSDAREGDIVDTSFKRKTPEGTSSIEFCNRGVYKRRREKEFETVETIGTSEKGRNIGIKVYQEESGELIYDSAQDRKIKENSPEFNEWITKVNQAMLV